MCSVNSSVCRQMGSDVCGSDSSDGSKGAGMPVVEIAQCGGQGAGMSVVERAQCAGKGAGCL